MTNNKWICFRLPTLQLFLCFLLTDNPTIEHRSSSLEILAQSLQTTFWSLLQHLATLEFFLDFGSAMWPGEMAWWLPSNSHLWEGATFLWSSNLWLKSKEGDRWHMPTVDHKTCFFFTWSKCMLQTWEVLRTWEPAMVPYGCFLKWWYPQNTPKWSFLVGKPMGLLGKPTI